MTRLVFMGTPAFARRVVEELWATADRGWDVVGVLTRPDQPVGRGQQVAMSAVKEFALAHAVPVQQPRTLRQPEPLADLAALQPDVIVVAAYGLILPQTVLDLPAYGCLNVHASLLPRHRGASPVTGALLAGDDVTGSTIMRMDAGMDTGPILAQAALAIQPDDTGGTLTARLAQQGAELLAETLPRWLAGQITPQPQDARLATLCRPLRKEQGLIDWARPASEIARAVRAFNPWPAASTVWHGQQLRVLRAKALAGPAGQEPGWVSQAEGALVVATGDGLLRLDELQLAGRAAMSAFDFARGQRSFAASRLG